jgi:amino acid adenylation domain-containing protein
MFETEAPPQSAPLSQEERRKLLVDWNATELGLPNLVRIQEPIEQRARDFPDSVAVVCRDGQLTYSELNARADQVAGHLRELGVGPEELVGICVERSLEMVIGLLGILKSGGAYVPLDPTYPKERLAFMLEDAKPLVLLTQSALLDKLPHTAAHILCLDRIDRPGDTADGKKLNDLSRTGDHCSPLAYVIYTSGSTGKPKGVMVEHGNVLNFFAAMDACIPRSGVAPPEGERAPNVWLSVTSPSFDISVLELFWTLSRGFKVVVYSGDDVGKIENQKSRDENAGDHSIAALIERHGVTHLQCTPSMAGMLLLDKRTRNALGQLQTLLIGGEAFPVKLARELRGVFKGTVLNMYGPTETTVWSTTWQLPTNAAPDRISVGRPIANTQIYIVDSNLQPVPMGAEGELLIGGAGVARGYLGREQLTAERFIRNSFEGSRSLRLYRTGDLARYLPDGNIELLGRIDQQVKIRGHRVELGEIEALLNEHPAVRESVVLLRGLANGEKALTAYIVAREGIKLTREDLRQHARNKLPEHMVPAHVVLMEAFPQTPNKKIDRNAFPDPQEATAGDNEKAGRPATAVEEELAVLWKELLGLQRVGPDANFFDLGGHSMLAMQLVSKVRKRFNVDFPLKNVFERQTLAGMAEIIEAMSWSNFAKRPPAGEREVVDV